jgi:hypothetical protein
MVYLASCALPPVVPPCLGPTRVISVLDALKISLDTRYLPEYTRAHLLSLVNLRFRCQR